MTIGFLSVCLFLPYVLGPGPTYPFTYPPTGYYGPPPQQQGYPTTPAHCTPSTNKSHITNSAHNAANYNQHQQQHLPLHPGAPHVAPSAYGAPPSSTAPAQLYGTTPATLPTSAPPPPNPQRNPPTLQQHIPYGTSGGYYGQQPYHTPQAQHLQQQPSLVPAPASGPGAPLYPIVSYPSAPGSSQYGTLRSSQTSSAPGAVPTLMSAPLHQYPPGNSAPTTTVQHGYSVAPPPSQPAATVNGQGDTGASDRLIHGH